MLKRRALGVVTAGLVFLGSHTATAQVSREEFDALKSEVGVLREAVRAQSEILRQFLERAGMLRDSKEAPFKEVLLSVDDAASYGKPDARVTIVEFSDYQCPFCARHATAVFPQIEREYIQTGRVRYIFRDYPIESAHPQAFKAHEAVHCAADQGRRREMHDKVFSNQRAMSPAALTAHAQALGLDRAGFDTCLAASTHAAKIRRAMAAGQQAGVRGTPTFFVGLTEPHGATLKAVRRIVGAQPYSTFQAVVDELLSSK